MDAPMPNFLTIRKSIKECLKGLHSDIFIFCSIYVNDLRKKKTLKKQECMQITSCSLLAFQDLVIAKILTTHNLKIKLLSLKVKETSLKQVAWVRAKIYEFVRVGLHKNQNLVKKIKPFLCRVSKGCMIQSLTVFFSYCCVIWNSVRDKTRLQTSKTIKSVCIWWNKGQFDSGSFLFFWKSEMKTHNLIFY